MKLAGRGNKIHDQSMGTDYDNDDDGGDVLMY